MNLLSIPGRRAPGEGPEARRRRKGRRRRQGRQLVRRRRRRKRRRRRRIWQRRRRRREEEGKEPEGEEGRSGRRQPPAGERDRKKSTRRPNFLFFLRLKCFPACHLFLKCIFLWEVLLDRFVFPFFPFSQGFNVTAAGNRVNAGELDMPQH